MAILRAEHLQKSYKKRQILKDVSLAVHSAEVVGLLGPNGAGKTTSFYMIVGLVGADSGKIFINDLDITQAPMHERARAGLGYLAQEASVFRKLTVAQNILAVLELRKDLTRDQRQAKLELLLDEFQITHLRASQGISLSGGERRRLEIARALATEPEFILLDEPFAGVDPISVLEIQKIIRHLVARDIGVLITDHNVRETLGICHRAYILSEGRILTEGSPDDILNNEQARKVYLGDNFQL
ncbi:MAG TPA: LPS export ABC transporter ATP-binding protein [Thiolinea sp.]|nr:LPS export ABC transporter ATP-binding protein [Thiolinea sp.]